MNTNRLLPICIMLFISSANISTTEARAQGTIASVQRADVGKLPPVLKAKDPIEVVGTVVAISQETVVEGLDGSADILLMKIEKVEKGKDPGLYVRADFAFHQKYLNSKYKQVHLALHQLKTWNVHLRPPSWTSECAWPIPPPPKHGEEVGIEVPIMISVGRPKAYPDINTLPCYAFEAEDIEGIEVPNNAK